jgi:hypothetical protein
MEWAAQHLRSNAGCKGPFSVCARAQRWPDVSHLAQIRRVLDHEIVLYETHQGERFPVELWRSGAYADIGCDSPHDASALAARFFLEMPLLHHGLFTFLFTSYFCYIRLRSR